MQEEISADKIEQYQMNGALVGLILGLIGGLVFMGFGGAISTGVAGLFVGALLGSVIGRLNQRGAKFIIGVIVVVITFALVRNTIRWVQTATAPDIDVVVDEESPFLE